MAAPSALAFWARRQAHETAIHRADAESASGAVPEYAPDFAADGIDELIMGFGQRRKYRPADLSRRRRAGAGHRHRRRLALGRRPGPHPGAPRPMAQGGCTVSGPASGVYLFLWNRSGDAPANVTVTGDRGCLTAWQSSVRVRWG